MARQAKRRPERTAGAFLGPDLLVPVPLRTLDDDYRDDPAEPADSDREPDPESPGRVRRVIERITGRSDRH
jgi:hypothetical protein